MKSCRVKSCGIDRNAGETPVSLPSANSVFRSRLYVLSLLLLGTLLSACAPKHTPLVHRVSASAEERSSLASLLLTRDSEIRSLRSLSRVDVTEGKNRSSVRGAIVFDKPDKFRLELLPLSAAYTLQLLVAQEGAATLLNPADKQAVQSSSASGLLQAALKLPLSERDLMSYFLARVPGRFAVLIQDSSEARVERDAASSEMRVLLLASGDQWTVDTTTGLLTSAVLLNRFDKSVDVEFSFFDTRTSAESTLPGSIVVRLARQGLEMRFSIITAKVNQEIPLSLFKVEIPGDYSVIRKN